MKLSGKKLTYVSPAYTVLSFLVFNVDYTILITLTQHYP